MIAIPRGVIWVLLLGLLSTGLCGCDRKLSSFDPFATPVTEEHGITTPAERILSLQELRKKASKTADPWQREAICVDLAEQIRREPDSIIRGEIFRTMAAYGGRTADLWLRTAVRDPDADVRVIVCDLWGTRRDAEAAGVLEGVVASDSDCDVRMAAVRALGHSKDKIAVRALGPVLDDPDPAMRHCAMVALHETTGKDIGTDPPDVAEWRQYIKSGEVTSPSLARRLFWWAY